MKIYFLSQRPCALFINGESLGKTDEFLRYIHLSLKDGVSVLFQAENALPIHFFLTENIRFSPPEKVCVCLLKNALVLYAKEFIDADFTLIPIAQQRFHNALVSVFKQGSVQLTTQTNDGFFTATLPPSFCSCSIETTQDLLVLISPSQLAVFDYQCRLLLLEDIESYTLNNNELTLICPPSNCYLQRAEKRYLCSGDTCLLQESRLLEKQGTPPTPYAFFESLLNGEIRDDLLSNELVDEKENLRRFLGDFVAILMTEDNYTCALIKRKAQRLYQADYFTVQTQEDKIVDITG